MEVLDRVGQPENDMFRRWQTAGLHMLELEANRALDSEAIDAHRITFSDIGRMPVAKLADSVLPYSRNHDR